MTIARAVLDELDVVGVLCVEFFVTREGTLLINELAPRPHNSGHLTFDACVTSQFEQQLRADLRSAAGRDRAAAAGGHGQPAGRPVAGGRARLGAPRVAFRQVKLHLYGKVQPRAGRKMGHLTALADAPGEAVETVLAARVRLGACDVGIEFLSASLQGTIRMMLDDMKNAERYYNLHLVFARALPFFPRPDLAGLDSGKYELQGERLFALINRDPGAATRGLGSKRIASTSTFKCWSTAARRSAGARRQSAAS